jgi:uncharacterized membrane protein
MDDVLSEETLNTVVDLLVRFVEAAGAVIIFTGAVVGFIRFVLVSLRSRQAQDYVPIRLDFGRFLALGLDFQLAGDILRTAIAPTFNEIGQLAAIAAIRTALNYFLAREIKEERAEIAQRDDGSDTPKQGPAGRSGNSSHLR